MYILGNIWFCLGFMESLALERQDYNDPQAEGNWRVLLTNVSYFDKAAIFPLRLEFMYRLATAETLNSCIMYVRSALLALVRPRAVFIVLQKKAVLRRSQDSYR